MSRATLKLLSLSALAILPLWLVSCSSNDSGPTGSQPFQGKTFEKYYGQGLTDCGYAAVMSNDGNYLIGGYSVEAGPDDQMYAAKLDDTGGVVWDYIDGTSANEQVQTIVPVSSGYVLGVSVYAASQTDFQLVMLDEAGTPLWSRKVGSPRWDYLSDVRKTLDGGFITTGRTASSQYGDADVYVVKASSDGYKQWDVWLTRSGNEFPTGVVETGDGTYVIAGHRITTGNPYDIFLEKIDSTGATLWDRTIGAGNDQCYAMQRTADGGFILVGQTSVGGAGGYDAYVVKTDTAGMVQWEKRFGGVNNDRFYSVAMVPGGYFFTGSTVGQAYSTSDMYLVKTDLNGTKIWSKSYGANQSETAYAGCLTLDGGYLVAGQSSSQIASNSVDIMVVKTDPAGNE